MTYNLTININFNSEIFNIMKHKLSSYNLSYKKNIDSLGWTIYSTKYLSKDKFKDFWIKSQHDYILAYPEILFSKKISTIIFLSELRFKGNEIRNILQTLIKDIKYKKNMDYKNLISTYDKYFNKKSHLSVNSFYKIFIIYNYVDESTMLYFKLS